MEKKKLRKIALWLMITAVVSFWIIFILGFVLKDVPAVVEIITILLFRTMVGGFYSAIILFIVSLLVGNEKNDNSERKTSYEIEMDCALKKLDIALGYNKLEEFIFCYGGYGNYTHDSLGNNVPSIDLIMQSIYSKSEELPNLLNDFYNVLLNMANNNKYGYFVIHLLNIIEYQYRQEKLGETPFKIDHYELLNSLKNNINLNKEFFERRDSHAPEGYIPLIAQHDDIVENYFGLRIL